MFCPKCKTEYREGFYTCKDCNVDLVDMLPSEAIGEPKDQVANQILGELRRQTVWYQRICKINAIGFFILGVLIIALIVSIMPMVRMFSSPVSTRSIPLASPESWTEARDLLDKGRSNAAIEMIKKLIKTNPEYHYGYALLASAYQQSGDWKKAEENYAKAYELFPVEDYEKNLKAIREAMKQRQKGSVSK
jgi:tetratricopeptide (TPR) repeat protein